MKDDDTDPTDVLDGVEQLLSALDAWDPDNAALAEQRTATHERLTVFRTTVLVERFRPGHRYAIDFNDRHWELLVSRVHDGHVHAFLLDATGGTSTDAVSFPVEEPTYVEPLD